LTDMGFFWLKKYQCCKF